MYSGLHVKYRLLLSDFYETWFSKIIQILNFMKIPPVWAEFFFPNRKDGRRDGRDEADIRFWQFCEGA